MKNAMWLVSFSKQESLNICMDRVTVLAEDGEAAIKRAEGNISGHLVVSGLELLGQENEVVAG